MFGTPINKLDSHNLLLCFIKVKSRRQKVVVLSFISIQTSLPSEGYNVGVSVLVKLE